MRRVEWTVWNEDAQEKLRDMFVALPVNSHGDNTLRWVSSTGRVTTTVEGCIEYIRRWSQDGSSVIEALMRVSAVRELIAGYYFVADVDDEDISLSVSAWIGLRGDGKVLYQPASLVVFAIRLVRDRYKLYYDTSPEWSEWHGDFERAMTAR